MLETGTVTTKDGMKLTIRLGAIEGCSCCVNEDCKTNNNVIQAYDKRRINPGIGDQVEIEVSGAKTARMTGTLLIPGAVFFALAYFLVSITQAPEWARFISGFAGAALGLWLSVFISKKFQNDLPEVVRVAPVNVYPVDDETMEHPV